MWVGQVLGRSFGCTYVFLFRVDSFYDVFRLLTCVLTNTLASSSSVTMLRRVPPQLTHAISESATAWNVLR